MAKNNNKTTQLVLETNGKAPIEYCMSKQMVEDTWASRPKNYKGDKFTYLKEVVNEEFGLKGYCVKIIVG